MKPDMPDSSRRAVAVFRWMLRLYPNAFRREYADKLILLFLDQLRDAKARKTTGVLVRFWVRMLADTGFAASREQWSDLKRIVGSGSPAALLLHVFPTPRRGFCTVLFLVVLGFVGRMLVTPQSYEATTRIVSDEQQSLSFDPLSETYQSSLRQLSEVKTLENVVRAMRPGLPAETVQSEVKRIGWNMTVCVWRKIPYVEVRYSASQAIEAAAMANRIADAFMVRRLQENGRQDFAIIDRAVPPLRARTPTLPQALIQGTVLGAFAGGAVALILCVVRRLMQRTDAV